MANIDSKNLLVAVKAFARANALPLDRDEVWESLSEAQKYVASPTAYPGQVIKVLINGKYRSFIIQPATEGNNGLTLEEMNGEGSSQITYVQVVDNLPTQGQAQGIIYIQLSNDTGYIWTGKAWKEIFKDVSMDISNLQELVSTKANLDGATFTGEVLLNADPVKDLGAVTKQYVDRLINNLVSTAPGIVDSQNPLPDSYFAGQTWRVVEKGVYVGQQCEIGDLIICVADGNSKIDSDFIVVQANIEGAITGPEASIDANIVIFDGITGKVIKDSQISIASLQDIIDKKHEHSNKSILDSFNKTQTELLTDFEKLLEEKVDKDLVYTKEEIDSSFETIHTNLNSKVSKKEVEDAMVEYGSTILDNSKDYVESRIGGIDASTTIKQYIDNSIGSGGTDAAEAIATAKAEAISASNKYTDNQIDLFLQIIEF